ncbi:MAG: DNA-directed DNA polymerase eta rad30 [Trizodia sp. TS-e1964]|nr:MAG: DNA-directed DNA polymerase eta rad30 [Trizodia sp. TS-e1964]
MADPLGEYQLDRVPALAPHHRHQGSLEHAFEVVITAPSPSVEERAQALPLFDQIIAGYRHTNPYVPEVDKYDTALIVERCHNFAPTEEGKVRATGKGTPNPDSRLSPNASISRAGIISRVATLTEDCLIRDHHRCLLTAKFHADEAALRLKRDGNKAVDDDGLLLLNDRIGFTDLDVAHIIPHSVGVLPRGSEELSDAQLATLNILDMFDPGIHLLLEAENIDGLAMPSH